MKTASSARRVSHEKSTICALDKRTQAYNTLEVQTSKCLGLLDQHSRRAAGTGRRGGEDLIPHTNDSTESTHISINIKIV